MIILGSSTMMTLALVTERRSSSGGRDGVAGRDDLVLETSDGRYLAVSIGLDEDYDTLLTALGLLARSPSGRAPGACRSFLVRSRSP